MPTRSLMHIDPGIQAGVLLAISVVGFLVKYLTSMVLANHLGMAGFERYAVAVASVVSLSAIVELGLGKQGIALLPRLLESGEFRLAAGYARFALRTVFLGAMGVAVVLSLSQRPLEAMGIGSFDDAASLLPIMAMCGVCAEMLIAIGGALAATMIVRVGIPALSLSLVGALLWSREPGSLLDPKLAVAAYGAGWGVGLLVLLATFAATCPPQVRRGAADYRPREWFRGGLGFAAVAMIAVALLEGSITIAEFARVEGSDLSIYAVCIETGGFVLLLVKSVDKFYLQRISRLIARRDLPGIRRLRHRRATLILVLCAIFNGALIVFGRPLLRTFGDGFERGFPALVTISLATSLWTMTSISQWFITFVDGPRPALRITLTGVALLYAGIFLMGQRAGLNGIGGVFLTTCLAMSGLLELRARATLRRLGSRVRPESNDETTR